MAKVKIITSKEESSIDIYFKEISKNKVLTAEEEIDLVKAAQSGDQKAFTKLISSNLRFVVSIAKQYQNKGVLLLDLINEGNIGLINAIENFDLSLGYRFISYAVYWIRQSILSALTEQAHIIHIPFNQYYLGAKAKKILEESKQKGIHLSEEDIAKQMSVKIEDIKSNIGHDIGFAVSLNTKIGDSEDDKNRCLLDITEDKNIDSPDSNLMKDSILKDIIYLLDKVLDEREKSIIILNYGIGKDSPMSFSEISRNLNLTTESIRQIKEKAMRKLRLYEGNSYLKQYL